MFVRRHGIVNSSSSRRSTSAALHTVLGQRRSSLHKVTAGAAAPRLIVLFRSLDTNAAVSAVLQQQQQQQQRLDASSIQQLVSNTPVLSELLGGAEALTVTELLDGVINVVFAVHGCSGESVLVKQALPYVRAVGESFPLSRDRMDVEAAAMQLLHACCPAHIPELLLYDSSRSILAMQYLPAPHHKLLYCIRQGQMLPGLSTQLAELLSAYLAHTNLDVLPAEQASAAIQQFANCDIVSANEQVVLIGPFDASDTTNRWTSPQLDCAVQQMWCDPEVQASAAAMLHLYRTHKQALIHNDLHAGNLLVAPGSLYLIDWEFATTGPVAFDLGCLLGNLMLAVLALQGMEQVEQQQQQQYDGAIQQQQQQGGSIQQQQHSRRAQAQWLIQVMQEFWQQFQQLYPRQLAAAQATAAAGGSIWQPPASRGLPVAAAAPAQFTEQEWQQLLADSCGYAGCCIIRLTVGLHHYPDIQSIQDTAIRAAVELRCLKLGQQLLKLRETVSGNARSAAAAAVATKDAKAGSLRQQPQQQQQEESMLTIQQLVALMKGSCGGWLE